MLGFTNPLVGDPTDGTGMSSIFNAAWITEESRTEKFYFNKHINDIEVKSVFFFKDGNTTSLSSAEIEEIINFENIFLNVTNPDLEYGSVNSSIEFVYDNQMPNGINLHVNFNDVLPGLSHASVNFAERIDGAYIVLNPTLNQNFTYYDELILSSSKTIELPFSELPDILATTNVAIHDNAGNFISFNRNEDVAYFEIVNLDKTLSFSQTTIQPMIFVSKNFNSVTNTDIIYIAGSEFEDYLVLPGHFDDYTFTQIFDVTQVRNGNKWLMLLQ